MYVFNNDPFSGLFKLLITAKLNFIPIKMIPENLEHVSHFFQRKGSEK